MTGQKQNYKKKAQTELLGLAIVVVLLSIGIMLVLVYSSKEVPSQLKDMNEELADKFIHTMLDTTTDCDLENPLTIQDLILDVAESGSQGTIDCYDGRNSFTYLNDTFKTITDDTVSLWKDGKYQFKIYLNPQLPIYFFGSKTCSSRMGKEYISPIKKGAPVYITLYICG